MLDGGKMPMSYAAADSLKASYGLVDRVPCACRGGHCGQACATYHADRQLSLLYAHASTSMQVWCAPSSVVRPPQWWRLSVEVGLVIPLPRSAAGRSYGPCDQAGTRQSIP
eukprot:364342-Chlamydomonas_euryale.AAC.4